MKTINRFLLAGLILIGIHAAADAAVVVLTPTIDGNIRSDGSGGFSSNNFIIGNTGAPGAMMYGLIQFDLSSYVPAGNEVISLSLTLIRTGPDGPTPDGDVNAQLYEGLRDFTSAATWTRFAAGQDWEVAGGTGVNDRGEMVSSAVVNNNMSALTPVVFSNTSNFVGAANDVLSGDGILSLWLGIEGSASAAARHVYGFYSSEVSVANYRPVLTIEYAVVPEPGITALAAFAGIVLVFRRKVCASVSV